MRFFPNYFLLLLLLSFVGLSCTACSAPDRQKDNADLIAYRQEVNAYFDTLSSCREAFEAVDVQSPEAGTAILSLIDQMTEATEKIADTEAPEELVELRQIAKEARDSMQSAREQFHTAFEGDKFDSEAFDRAMASYEAAGTQIGRMLQLLRSTE